MSVAIIIPARYASSRFPGKPLAPLVGADGASKPLIQRSFEAASAVGADMCAIATDDARIADIAGSFDAPVIMTPTCCANGTERVAAAMDSLPDNIDVIVNFQGDAPLTPPHMVEALISHMRDTPDCTTATAGVRCAPTTYRHLVDDQEAGRVGGTTLVCDHQDNALYFSKRVLPHIPPGSALEEAPPVLLHLGLYAYRRAALSRYAALPACPLEEIEGLEQLRFLYHGVPMKVLTFDPPGWDSIELNNPTDTAAIEAVLAARGIA